MSKEDTETKFCPIIDGQECRQDTCPWWTQVYLRGAEGRIEGCAPAVIAQVLTDIRNKMVAK